MDNPYIYENQVGDTGEERWVEDTKKELNLDEYYIPHTKQFNYHASPAPHRLLGGAAGPGKSLAIIMDHLAGATSFTDPIEAAQVHTLMLRRTYPQLDGSLIPRFREKVPRELYASFNETKKIVTWRNGAQSHFGSMQYEQDVWNYQGGQYWKIDFDELTQFTLYQWFTIGAWNRCPVDPHCTKGGATNPVGVSASDFACLFGADGKGKRPSANMDANQRANYHPEDYEYFPCTYLDNPIYANDPLFLKQLENYPGPIRDALKLGKWGALGTYFDIWDEAVHVYPFDDYVPEPWHVVWMSGDWGFAHYATWYWHAMDEQRRVRTFYEFVTQREDPEVLAESIVREHTGLLQMMKAQSGRPDYQFNLEPWAFYSHDAFHQKYSVNTLANQMTAILQPRLGVQLVNGGTDKKGGEQLMYAKLNRKVIIGERVNQETGEIIPVTAPEWEISDACPRLIAVMPQAATDPKKPEQIVKFLGDDPIDGARQGIYGKFSGKVKLPDEARVAAMVTSQDPTIRHLQAIKAQQTIARENARETIKSRRWRPPVR